MGVKLNIEYEQLLELAKQLPLKQKEQFILDLRETQDNSTSEKGKEKEWEEILKDFPVATEEEIENFEEIRKDLNKWGNPK